MIKERDSMVKQNATTFDKKNEEINNFNQLQKIEEDSLDDNLEEFAQFMTPEKEEPLSQAQVIKINEIKESDSPQYNDLMRIINDEGDDDL